VEGDVVATITARLKALEIKILTTGRYSDGGNLYLVVDEGGSKRWVFLYRWHGKQIEAGGGSISKVTLKQARDWASEGRAMLRERPPRNPKTVWQQQRRATTTVPTFAEMAETFFAGQSWRSPITHKQYRSMVDRFCRSIAGKPVNEITTADLIDIIKNMNKVAPTNSWELRRVVERTLDTAQVLGHIDPDRANPARWKGHLSLLLPHRAERTHLPATPYADLPAFMTILRANWQKPDLSWHVPTLALTFLILTAARSAEVRGARWSEIDLKTRIWLIPKERMKSYRSHLVPLSDGAIEVIKIMQPLRMNDYVFPAAWGKNGNPITTMGAHTMGKVLRALECPGTVHGFRSSFRDWAGNETNTPREVCEVALAHLVGNATERSYKRTHEVEKHRQLMTAWNQYLSTRSADVIPLRPAG
jgi:integrase